MKKLALAASFLWAVPFFASAQGVNDLVRQFGELLNNLIPILIALALIIFFWGLIQYIRSSGEGRHGTGRNIMIAGIVALFVMVSIWGIIRLLQNTLLPGGNVQIDPPSVPLDN